MANRDGKPPGPQKELRVRNIIAGKSSTKEMVVERLTMNTNDAKSAESDLLSEVAAALTEQTKTIGSLVADIKRLTTEQAKSFKDMISAEKQTNTSVQQTDKDLDQTLKDLTSAIKALTGAESGGAEGGGGGGPAKPGDTRRDVKFFEAATKFQENMSSQQTKMLSDFLDRMAPEGSKPGIMRIVGESMIQQLESVYGNFASSVQRFSSSLIDISNVTDWARDRFKTGVEGFTSGVFEVGDAFMDVFPGLIRGGDNLASTLKTVKDSLQSGLINPLGTMGSDIYAVSEALYGTRDSFRDQGVNAMSRLGFEEANDALISLFALERRRDVGANISSSLTQRNMARQLEVAQLIATNTGQTALEVLKGNMERAKAVANAQSAGVLSGPDGEAFTKAMAAFNGAGMTGFADMIAGIAEAGGDPTLYLSQNQDFAQGLATSGKYGEYSALIDAIRSGADINTIMQLAGRMGGGANTGVAGSTTIGSQMKGLAGEAGLAQQYAPDIEPGMLGSFMTWGKDFLANTMGGSTGMVVALAANTAAIIANTMALIGGGGLGGMLKGIGGKVGSAFKGAARLGGKALGAGAGLAASAGGAAIRGGGKALAGMGMKSLIKKIPLVGLLAGLVFGAGRAMSGDFAGAGMEVASGAAGTIPGLGTAASLGIDATLAARDMGAFGSGTDSVVGPSTTSVSKNAGIRNDSQRIAFETNRLLDRLLVLTQDEIDVMKDIKANTAKTTVQAPDGFWSSLFADEPAPAASVTGGTASP